MEITQLNVIFHISKLHQYNPKMTLKTRQEFDSEWNENKNTSFHTLLDYCYAFR